MNSNTMAPESLCIYNHLSRIALVALSFIILSMGSLGFTQEPAEQSPKRLRDLSDAEAKQLIEEALREGLPANRVDQVTVLALNRSRLVVPELLSKLEAARQDPAASEEFIYTVADIIAYVGDEVALDALLQLVASDYQRFAHFIGRALDYAHGRRNPYASAYYIVGRTNQQVDALILDWILTNAPRGHGFKDWAEAIAEREKGPLNETIFEKDPLISRLRGGVPPGLLEELRKHPQWVR